MEPIEIEQAQADFEDLVRRAEAGEEIVIARDGHPVARLVPHVPRREKRRGGQWRGKIWISPDFDAPDPELEARFYDGPIEPEEGPPN